MNILFSAKSIIKSPLEYIRVLIKWLICAAIVGMVGGVFGSVFHLSIDYVTEFRSEHLWILFFLPIGGIIIALLYAVMGKKGKINTDRVIESAREDESVPLVMAPLIFISTCITHLLGGSAGREGAALQLGGSIGYNLGKVFRLSKEDMHIIVMSGMSAVFSALFGTPLTAAFFALEVTNVGIIHYVGLVPCLIASITAQKIAQGFGLAPLHFDIVATQTLTTSLLLKAIFLAVLCAIVSILFCAAIKKCEYYSDKLIPNRYIRAAVGGALIVGLTFAVGSFDYNGAGMDVIIRAMNGEASSVAFLLKIIFTAITIAAGFKGGEIVPSFFIGSTFGCFVGGLLGMDPGLGAAIGFVALFCGVVNCPIASIILAFEAFGTNSILIMAVACGVSYMMSGYFGLYTSQKIAYSKLSEAFIEVNTK